MSQVVEMTPYEAFLEESLEKEKKQLELLTAKYQSSGPLKRRMLKARLDEITQNVQILTSDLQKYGHGLSWLREPTKERDEKAERLGPVDVSAIIGQQKPATPQPAPRPAGAPSASVGTPRPVSVAVGNPAASVGTPRPSVQVGTPRPSVGTPKPSTPVGQPSVTVGLPRPSVPVGQPKAVVQVEQPKPSVPVSQPKASTPVEQVSSTPQVGTTAEAKLAEAPSSSDTHAEQPKPAVPKQEEKKSEEQESASAESGGNAGSSESQAS